LTPLGHPPETVEMKLARIERLLEQTDRVATEATQGVVVEIEEPDREAERLNRIHRAVHDAHVSPGARSMNWCVWREGSRGQIRHCSADGNY